MKNLTLKFRRSGLSSQRMLWGIIFLLPWIIGFLLFFLKPLVEVVIYSFNEVSVVDGGVDMKYLGLANYVKALTIDVGFNKIIISMLMTSFPKVIIVIVFSLLAAVLINGKYFGRSAARTIFFIPIIMGTSIATVTLAGADMVAQEMGMSEGFSGFGLGLLFDILFSLGLPMSITAIVANAVFGIFSILAISGVPILVFLGGLQSISPSLYEVAKIEGATGYETFWKVTLPMVSPMALLATVYTMIDAFSRTDYNIGARVFRYASEYFQYIAFTQVNYGLSAAMCLMYFVVNVIIISIVSFIISRRVYYNA